MHKSERGLIRKTKLYMDTVVDIQVIPGRLNSEQLVEAQIDRAFGAFKRVEEACSRFSPESELMLAAQYIGKPVPISPYLFEPLRFALAVAEWSGGQFDPTVGKVLEDLGFNRHYLTGEKITSVSEVSVTYQDIAIDEEARTLLLKKPLVIDLGAVAKGFAIDLAASELKAFDGFTINAGGDIFAGGQNDSLNKWKIGIQHPFEKDQIIDMVEISNEAICTSGSYERKSSQNPEMHHIVHPETKESPNAIVSCSVVAPFAMMADAFSTTGFILGIQEGGEKLEEAHVKALFITPELQKYRVGGI